MTGKIEYGESGSGVEYAVVSTSIEIPEESLVDNLSGDVTFDVMAFGGQSTVCSSAPKDTKRSSSYQSEAQLEDAFIKQLCAQGYEYLAINSEEDLIANLRKQLELLNKVTFSDKEWERIFKGWIASDNEGIVERTRRIQQDHVYPLRRDNGTVKNIQLLDKRNVYNNRLQVMNQYTQTGNHENRYDVTILINGLPLVHVELKRRGIAIEEAFNQIERYQRDSFWSGSGFLSMCSYSSSAMARIRSTIPTPRASLPSKKRRAPSEKARRPLTASSSPVGGRRPTTCPSTIWSHSLRLSSRSTRF